jgi:hypothetical protein
MTLGVHSGGIRLSLLHSTSTLAMLAKRCLLAW